MRFNTTTLNELEIYGNEIQQVDKSVYLGSVVSTEDPTQKNINNRLAEARTTFHILRPIWKSKQYSRNTKVKLNNSNVKSVLLYGSECWRVTKTDMRYLSSFHHNCLRQICNIFWQNTFTNTNLLQMTNSKCIIDDITQKRFRWLGNVLRMEGASITKNSPKMDTTRETTGRKTNNNLSQDC